MAPQQLRLPLLTKLFVCKFILYLYKLFVLCKISKEFIDKKKKKYADEPFRLTQQG